MDILWPIILRECHKVSPPFRLRTDIWLLIMFKLLLSFIAFWIFDSPESNNAARDESFIKMTFPFNALHNSLTIIIIILCIHEIASENTVCDMAAILSRGRRAKYKTTWDASNINTQKTQVGMSKNLANKGDTLWGFPLHPMGMDLCHPLTDWSEYLTR